MIRPGRMLGLLRRDLGRGWQAARHEYFTLPRIREWSWPFWGQRGKEVPVHVLTGAADWQLAAWALASFVEATEHSWPIVIHDDGTLTEDARATFMALFPQCRVISRKEADNVVEKILKPFPFCLEYRAMHRLGPKVFDMAHFATGSRFIALEPSTLFFRYPTEILQWVDGKSAETFFARDVVERSLLSPEQAKAELDIVLWSEVNTGISLMQKAVVDFDLCDRALAETSILRGAIERVESTLFAICASKVGAGGLLPRTYDVSHGKKAGEDAVARYYPDPVRNRFYAEGLRHLAPVMLAKAA